MIVKNEAHCIARCLESVKNYIDYWIICDTGSTDNTEQIIKEVLKDVPGEFHKNEWVDFSTNRNISLDLAKPKADYLLFIDADDYLQIDDNLCFNNLDYPVYNLNIHHSGAIYPRIALISSTIQSQYIGVLHEYIDVNNITAKLLQGCYIIFGGDGARSQDPLKYVKDSNILQKEIEKNPSNPRNVFYYAQSCYDSAYIYKEQKNILKSAEYFTKSAEAYQKRALMENGWIEEKFFAAYRLGNVLEEMSPNDTNSIINAYTMAYNLLPHRAESLLALSIFFRRKKLFQLSYFYAKLGINLQLPEDGLFIYTNCYLWLIKYELALAAFCTNKFQESYDMFKFILNNYNVNKEEREDIFSKMLLCKKYL